MFKKHASIVLVFDTETAAQKVIKNKLFIAGISVRTVKYEKKNTNIQCQKCQKFEHTIHFCKSVAVCQFCAQNHLIRLHTCKICKTMSEICIHTIVKCNNCADSHTVNTCTNLIISQQSAVSTEIISDSQLQQAINQASMKIDQ